MIDRERRRELEQATRIEFRGKVGHLTALLWLGVKEAYADLEHARPETTTQIVFAGDRVAVSLSEVEELLTACHMAWLNTGRSQNG